MFQNERPPIPLRIIINFGLKLMRISLAAGCNSTEDSAHPTTPRNWNRKLLLAFYQQIGSADRKVCFSSDFQVHFFMFFQRIYLFAGILDGPLDCCWGSLLFVEFVTYLFSSIIFSMSKPGGRSLPI